MITRRLALSALLSFDGCRCGRRSPVLAALQPKVAEVRVMPSPANCKLNTILAPRKMAEAARAHAACPRLFALPTNGLTRHELLKPAIWLTPKLWSRDCEGNRMRHAE